MTHVSAPERSPRSCVPYAHMRAGCAHACRMRSDRDRARNPGALQCLQDGEECADILELQDDMRTVCARRALRATLHSNRATCHLKLKDGVHAEEECTRALLLFPEPAADCQEFAKHKVLYRRAQARIAMARPPSSVRDAAVQLDGARPAQYKRAPLCVKSLSRLGLCGAHSYRRRPIPGHSIAVVGALKSSLWATAGGKGA